jgi:hypothetical protein
MTTLTISVDEKRLQQFQQSAAKLGPPIEDLIAKSIDEYLERQKRVKDASSYVLQKKEELYRRLAQ